MPVRKYPVKFYTTVDALCHEGSIADVCALIIKEFPEVPESSCKTFISKARAFGDCTQEYRTHNKNRNISKASPALSPEIIFGSCKPEQVENAVWTMLAKGRDAINQVIILEELTMKQAKEIEKLTIENKRLIENKQKELASQYEVNEKVIKDLSGGVIHSSQAR
jgi:hypothetical protein